MKRILKQFIKFIIPASFRRQILKYLARLMSRISGDQLGWVYQRLAVLESLEIHLEQVEQKLMRLESLEYKLKKLEEGITPAASLSHKKVDHESILSDKEYDELEGSICSGRRAVEDSYFNALADTFPNEARVLDMGCGQGKFVQKLMERGFIAEGIDANSTYRNIPGVTIGKLPEVLINWGNDSVDIVTSFHVIEHLELIKYREVVNEAFRVLKKGGKIFLETPNTQSLTTMSQYYYKDPTHLMPRHPEVYANILRFCGYKNVTIKNLPELDAYEFEEISKVDNVDEELLRQLNNKFLNIDNLLFANSGNILIIGEK